MTKSKIHIKPEHVGQLHKAMGVPVGRRLNGGDLMNTIAAAKQSGNTKVEKQAVFAKNAKGWNKG